MVTASAAGGSRAIARDAVRTRISQTAIALFAEHGFDQVTVEQIAAAVGVSARSVHRHFPAKEDLVVGDHTHWALALRDHMAASPAGQPVWESLHQAFRMLLRPPYGRPDARGQATLSVIVGVSSLRARFVEKHQGFARLLVPVVAERVGPDRDAMTAPTLVNAAIACFETALQAWTLADDPADIHDLLDRAFDIARPATEPA